MCQSEIVWFEFAESSFYFSETDSCQLKSPGANMILLILNLHYTCNLLCLKNAVWAHYFFLHFENCLNHTHVAFGCHHNCEYFLNNHVLAHKKNYCISLILFCFIRVSCLIYIDLNGVTSTVELRLFEPVVMEHALILWLKIKIACITFCEMWLLRNVDQNERIWLLFYNQVKAQSSELLTCHNGM